MSPTADPQRLVEWATATIGTREGSGRQRRWAHAAGISSTTAWCAAWIAYGLHKMGVRPPINPAYTGNWLEWEGGENIGKDLRGAQPGDLLVFDWGDGGRTDHIALYTGNGEMIAGNNSDNSVGRSRVPEANIVGIVRPKVFAGADHKSGVLGLPQNPVLEALEITGGGVLGLLSGAGGNAGDAIRDNIFPSAAEIAAQVIAKLADLLGINAAAIMLNIGLVGGGAFLVYYGIAKMAGADEPIRKLYARTPTGAVASAAVPG